MTGDPGRNASVFRQVFRYVHGAWTMRLLKFRYREVLRELAPLAMHLERELFPQLRNERCTRLALVPTKGNDGRFRMAGKSKRHEHVFDDTSRIAQACEEHNVTWVSLDAQLEYGQVIEALLLLFHAAPEVAGVAPAETPYRGSRRRGVARAMASSDGYHKFCTTIHYYPESARFDVAYTYCELIFSRAIKSYVQRGSSFNDHRALFWLAPRIAIAGFLAFMTPAAMLQVSVTASVAASIVLATACAITIGLAVNTMGSMQYDKEHYEKMRSRYTDEVRKLSRFPEASPTPLLELDSDGQVVYASPAADALLASVGDPAKTYERLLPPESPSLVRCCLEQPNEPIELPVALADRQLSCAFSAFPDEEAVIAAVKDVTDLKRVEEELRLLNNDLEGMVRKRTHELSATQDVTIMCLAGLAETRDPETGEHLERTRWYVRLLAEELRDHPRFSPYLNDDSIDRAFKSAPLHDIGKVGVPDSVLLKAGPLTPEEFEIMKKHTLWGGQALDRAEEKLGHDSFLAKAKEIAYYHHERWDGNGYPFGKKENEIPWAARLMAIADVYDALTSRRVYKEPWSHDKARDEIAAGRGTQFDPVIVEAFLRLEDDFIDVAQRFDEGIRTSPTQRTAAH